MEKEKKGGSGWTKVTDTKVGARLTFSRSELSYCRGQHNR